MTRLGLGAGGYGEAPRQVVLEEMAAVRKDVENYLAQFNALVATDVPAYNKAAVEQGVPTLFAGDPIAIAAPAGF